MTSQPLNAVVEQVGALLHEKIGLRAEAGLRGRLRRCIRDEAAARGEDLNSYVDALLVGGDALHSLLDSVTVQESGFFRHPEHFAMLAHEVLPRLDGPITIWSAACANGQEAYSLAMLLEEQGIHGSVIATDLSAAAVQRTQQGRYFQRELANLSPARIARHFTGSGDEWVVNEVIRDRVLTLEHNLLDPIPHQVRSCQIVFCRNVLIYFSAEHAALFLERVADALPAASLFLGAAESIWQLSDRFDTVRSGDTFSYRPRSGEDHRDRTAPAPQRPSRDRVRPDSRPYGPAAARPGHHNTERAHRTRDARPDLSATAITPSTPQPDATPAAVLARVGQLASAAGDFPAAVVAFRKCAYLASDDPMTHLNLGLALEGAGDPTSAQRAFAAARRAVTFADPGHVNQAMEGYTTADVIRLLDAKQATP